MRDRLWGEAWAAVAPLLGSGHRLLMPPGEWPRHPWPARFYSDRIEIADANVLFLHKGKIGGLKKSVLRHLRLAWRCVFANEVFACFIKNAQATLTPDAARHLNRIRHHLRSRAAKRVGHTVFFVHLPKAAGTSVWNFLSERVPSSVYYDTLESFLYNPPRRGEYDLVGGHVPLAVMAPFIGADDRVVWVMREPTARFRSAFLHSRRDSEDPATFTPVMQAMREQPLERFLAARAGPMELKQQLMMLGHDPAVDYCAARDAEIQRRAEAWSGDPRALFCTTDGLASFAPKICPLLDIAPGPGIARTDNAASPANQDAAIAEFERHRSAIEALNAPEQALYRRIAAWA